MTLYAYTGRNPEGGELHGLLEAEDERAVREALRRRGILVIETRVEPSVRTGRLKVPVDDLARLTAQLADMLDAGLPLGRCLQVLEGDTENVHLRRLMRLVASDVERGAALSAALSSFPQVFSEFFVGLVVAGERSGTLSQTLGRVARQLEADASLQRQIRQAFTYPAIVSSIGLVVIVFLVAKVVPVFENTYRQLGATLPGPTLVLLAASQILRSYGLMMAAALPLLIVGTRRFLRTDRGRELRDRIVLGLPSIGPVARLIVVHRFVSTLGTLLGSGVSTLEAFGVAERVADSHSVSHAVADIRDHVRRGEGISSAMSRNAIFPPQVASMVSVGEETGALPEMLDRAARNLETDIGHRMKRLLVRLEPMITTVLAMLVGFVVLGLYLPMFDLLGHVGH